MPPTLDRKSYHKKHGGKGSHMGCPFCDRAERMVTQGKKIAQYGRHPVIRVDANTAGMLPAECIYNLSELPEWPDE